MHYERAPRFSRVEVGWGAASAALRCAGLRSATAALGSNCNSVSGAKGLQESIGKSAGEWHFTLRERQALTRMIFPQGGNSNESRRQIYRNGCASGSDCDRRPEWQRESWSWKPSSKPKPAAFCSSSTVY